MLRCFHCDGQGYEDAETGDAAAEGDKNAIECHACQGSGNASDEDIAEAEGDRAFHLRHDEGEI